MELDAVTEISCKWRDQSSITYVCGNIATTGDYDTNINNVYGEGLLRLCEEAVLYDNDTYVTIVIICIVIEI